MMCDDKTRCSPYTKSFKHLLLHVIKFIPVTEEFSEHENLMGTQLSGNRWRVMRFGVTTHVRHVLGARHFLKGLGFEFWLKPKHTGKCCSPSRQNSKVCVMSKTYLLERKSLGLQWRATWELLITQRCFSPPTKDARVNLLRFCLHKTYYMGCNFTGWRLWTPRSLVNWSLPSLSSLCF